MSDNDCIRRGDAEALIYDLLDGEPAKDKWSDVGMRIADIPAVPQEMSAREFVSAFQLMCYKENIDGCSACPLWQTTPKYDCMLRENDPETIVAIVEKWAREHPEERSKNETDR